MQPRGPYALRVQLLPNTTARKEHLLCAPVILPLVIGTLCLDEAVGEGPASRFLARSVTDPMGTAVSSSSLVRGQREKREEAEGQDKQIEEGGDGRGQGRDRESSGVLGPHRAEPRPPELRSFPTQGDPNTELPVTSAPAYVTSRLKPTADPYEWPWFLKVLVRGSTRRTPVTAK